MIARSEFGMRIESLAKEYKKTKDELVLNPGYNAVLNNERIPDESLNRYTELKNKFLEAVKSLGDIGIPVDVLPGLDDLEIKKRELERIIEAERKNSIVLPNEDLQFITDKKLYDEIIKYFTRTFPNNSKVLNDKFKWNSSNSVATGSNSYIPVAVDMFLRQEMPEFKIARQVDLETNLQMFEDNKIDSGLVLRSLTGDNIEQAEYLLNQLKQRNRNIEFPIWIDLRGLTLDSDLNFNLTNSSRYKTAKCLNWQSETSYSKIDDFGLPKSKDKNSNRKIWITSNGLSRAFLTCDYSNLVLYNSNFSNSYDYGRVVVARVKEVGK